MAHFKKSDFVAERRHSTLTPAKSLRLAREFQQMTQHEVAMASGVPQPAIAGIESGRIALGADRAEKLALALKVHPAVLMWPQWEDQRPVAKTRLSVPVRKTATRRKPPIRHRFSLYWCTTSDGDEDWFVVARTANAARRFHEHAEGYDRGEALAERIAALPSDLLTGSGWLDGPDGEASTSSGWPSDELLIACGGEVAQQTRGGLRDAMGVVCKSVRFGERFFRAGDVVTNLERARGVKEPRGAKPPSVKRVTRARNHASR